MSPNRWIRQTHRIYNMYICILVAVAAVVVAAVVVVVAAVVVGGLLLVGCCHVGRHLPGEAWFKAQRSAWQH